MPLCHWSSHLFNLHAPSSTDVPFHWLTSVAKSVGSISAVSLVRSLILPKESNLHLWFQQLRPLPPPKKKSNNSMKLRITLFCTQISLVFNVPGCRTFPPRIRWTRNGSSTLNKGNRAIIFGLDLNQGIYVYSLRGRGDNSPITRAVDSPDNPGDSRFWTISPGIQIRVRILPDNRRSLPCFQ